MYIIFLLNSNTKIYLQILKATILIHLMAKIWPCVYKNTEMKHWYSFLFMVIMTSQFSQQQSS